MPKKTPATVPGEIAVTLHDRGLPRPHGIKRMNFMKRTILISCARMRKGAGAAGILTIAHYVNNLTPYQKI